MWSTKMVHLGDREAAKAGEGGVQVGEGTRGRVDHCQAAPGPGRV